MTNKPLLSIALLCSNHVEMVRRCLDSLVLILKRLPSELILLDTSTDSKVSEMLVEYTDNITKFEWINDFSAARNETVKRAKGEWYLYIDDDEWFEDIEVLIDFFQSGEYKNYGCANYIQRNFHDPDLVHYSDSWASRMIRLTPETHFESKIHEYLVPVPGKCKNLNLVANHTGYIAVTEEDMKKKFERNFVLLKEMILEEPERLRWRVQLAQEYNAVKLWDEQIAFCLENLEYTKNRYDKWDSRDIGTFYAGLTESYINTKEYQKVYEIADRAIKDTRCSELCHAYIYLRIATAAFHTENWSLAKKSIESYFLLDKELAKTPDKRANQEGALLVNEAFDDVPKKRAYSILIAAGLREGHTKDLKKYLPSLEWNQKVIYVFEPLVPILVESMATFPFEEIFVEMMQLMWNNKELQNIVLAEIYEWEQKNNEIKKALYEIMSRIEAPHWYIWYVKVLVADRKQDIESLLYALMGLFKNITNVFRLPAEILQICEKQQLAKEALYLSVPFETWREHLHTYIQSVSEMELLITEREFLLMKSVENIRYDYFFARVAEAKLFYHTNEGEYNKKREYLWNFAEKTMCFLRKYFQVHVFEETPGLLPTYGQAALYIEKAFEEENYNPKEMLRNLRAVVEVYPVLANVIRGFITAYGMEQDAKKKRQREEMKQLKIQILGQVKELIQQKKYTDALSIVQQLKQMQPDDLELATLALELRLEILK